MVEVEVVRSSQVRPSRLPKTHISYLWYPF